jgi:N-acyl-D-amino-acid deacylase
MAAFAARRASLLTLVLLALTLTASAQNPGTALYDVVIRNGSVLDGAGNPAIRADVAIKNGRFVRIGIVTGRGTQEIDASGKYVSPGRIEMMDQSRARWAGIRRMPRSISSPLARVV